MDDMDYVTIVELAKRMGIDRSGVRRYALARGFTFVKIRTQASRHQLTLALSERDATHLLKRRVADGFQVSCPDSTRIDMT